MFCDLGECLPGGCVDRLKISEVLPAPDRAIDINRFELDQTRPSANTLCSNQRRARASEWVEHNIALTRCIENGFGNQRRLGEKIAQLRWDDFELLIELILTRSGWRRLSEIGGFQKDVDLVLEQPVTGERMLVQVKSQADQATLNEFADRLATHSSQNRIVFASHTHIKAKKPLHTPTSQVDLLDRSRIARLSVECGAIDWILDRT